MPWSKKTKRHKQKTPTELPKPETVFSIFGIGLAQVIPDKEGIFKNSRGERDCNCYLACEEEI